MPGFAKTGTISFTLPTTLSIGNGLLRDSSAWVGIKQNNGSLKLVMEDNLTIKRSLAVFRRTQVSAEERYHIVLKTISDGTGMCTVIDFKATGYAIVVEDLAQFDRVEP